MRSGGDDVVIGHTPGSVDRELLRSLLFYDDLRKGAALNAIRPGELIPGVMSRSALAPDESDPATVGSLER